MLIFANLHSREVKVGTQSFNLSINQITPAIEAALLELIEACSTSGEIAVQTNTRLEDVWVSANDQDRWAMADAAGISRSALSKLRFAIMRVQNWDLKAYPDFPSEEFRKIRARNEDAGGDINASDLVKVLRKASNRQALARVKFAHFGPRTQAETLKLLDYLEQTYA